MHRRHLLESLSAYSKTWAAGVGPHLSFRRDEEDRILQTIVPFIDGTPSCFHRSCSEGHVTGSAMVTTPALDRVLLTLHGKLGLWLQLGGHADGHPLVHEVALKECHEESGLTDLAFLEYEHMFPRQGFTLPANTPLPFDLDYHHIPPRTREPAHIHYDVRFLIITKTPEAIVRSEESKDLRWFSLPDARKVTNERSMHRQFDKLLWLRDNLLR